MDDDSALYAQDSITRLLALLRAQFGDDYTYYEATPATPPAASEYPVMMVQKMSGTAAVGPTSTDEVTEEITLTIMLNKADDIGSANEKTTTLRHLQNIIEGQDPVTKYYRADTVLSVMRTFLTMEEWLINSSVNIGYGQIVNRNAPTVAVGNVKCQMWRRVIVPSRQ